MLFIGAVALLPAGATARAKTPARTCRSVGTDDTLRAIPRSLVAPVIKAFNLQSMPAEAVQHDTYFRCFRARVLACTVGANLPCGKADTRRHLPAANEWCAAHPSSDFIPLSVTGHATIYRWRCRGSEAATESVLFEVDPRGFITHFWKPIDP